MSDTTKAAARLVLLDRDGTINVDHGFVHRREHWQLIPGAADGMRALAAAGYALAVVTNQSGIARGFYTAADVDRLHAQMQRQLAEEGIELAAIEYCPHQAEDDCGCRKPRAGLGAAVLERLGDVDLAASWTIGDKPSDVAFGRRLGTRTVLLRSRYWDPGRPPAEADQIADSLGEAAQWILGPGTKR